MFVCIWLQSKWLPRVTMVTCVWASYFCSTHSFYCTYVYALDSKDRPKWWAEVMSLLVERLKYKNNKRPLNREMQCLVQVNVIAAIICACCRLSINIRPLSIRPILVGMSRPDDQDLDNAMPVIWYELMEERGVTKRDQGGRCGRRHTKWIEWTRQ